MGFTGFASGLIGFDSSGFGFEPGIGRARVRYIYFFLVWFFVSFCCFVIFRSAGREEKKKPVVGRRATANRNEKKKKGPAAFLTGLLFSFSCSSLLLPESLAAMVFFSLFFWRRVLKINPPQSSPIQRFSMDATGIFFFNFLSLFPAEKDRRNKQKETKQKRNSTNALSCFFFLTALMAVIGFFGVFRWFHSTLLCFTGCYKLLPSFTGFSLGLTGFC